MPLATLFCRVLYMGEDFELTLPDDDRETAVRRFLFSEASTAETPGQVVGWWERRRLPYNLAVGTAGIASLIAINVIGMVGPEPELVAPPLIAIVAYAGLANVMYTSGWVAELLLRPIFGRKTPVVGAAMFRYGFVFSVGLTLLPIAIAGIDFGFRVLKWLGGSG
ncbi:MAG: hypothetical protein ACT4P7_21665 [Gemmatimonadaceae bacterium]